MRVLLVSNGHFDSFLPLAAALDSEIDCTANIQIEQDALRQSILDYPITCRQYGAGVEDEDTERIRVGIGQLTGKELKLVFTKYPTRSFRAPANWKVSLEWSRWFRKNDFDLVHYNGTSMLYFQQNLLDQKSRKIFSVHDHIQHLGESSPQATLYMRYTALRSKRYRFVAHSDFVRQGFKEEFGIPGERIKTIRYGVLDLYHRWEDESVSQEPNCILSFGRISPYKGLEYLAEAWRIIRNENPSARLIVAGDGEFYFDISSLRSDPRVELYNQHVENAELVRLIQRASVVVLPYVEATQSGVIMTAYAFNKPVVATRVGALPEVVEDGITGLLVPPRDSVALANAVLDILSHPVKQEGLAQAIGRKTSVELAWRAIARQTIEVYRTCLG